MTPAFADATVGLAALAAYVALALLERRRSDRRHLGARLLALAVAVAALAALALSPARTVRRAGTRAVLLTDGATAADAERIADSAGASLVLRLADSTPDAAAIRARVPAVRELIVAGWGLDSARLPGFAGFAMRFVPSPLPPGLVDARWPARIVAGDALVVRGRLNGRGTVRLEAADGSADSAIVAADGSFALQVTPRERGFAQLLLRAGARTDTIGVQVATPAPLRLLLLRSAPDYEASRLRDWVARRGGRVAVRTRISAGRWRTERVNTDVGRLEPLSALLLGRFDVVVMDEGSARSLSGAERSALDSAVRHQGLGLLVDPRSPPFDAPAGVIAPRSARVRLGGALAPAVTLAPPALRAGPSGGTRGVPIVLDETGRAVAEWRPRGAGRIATTLVRNPSRWTLGGDRALFDRYWAELLGAVARPAPAWIAGGGPFPGPGEPIRLARLGEVLDSATVSRPDGVLDTVPLDPTPDSPGAEGIYWPRLTGPHRITGGGDTAWIRIGGPESWPGARAARRREATMAWAALRGPDPAPDAESPLPVPFPSWWFLALFAGAAGWLWWERRRIVADSEKEGRTGA